MCIREYEYNQNRLSHIQVSMDLLHTENTHLPAARLTFEFGLQGQDLQESDISTVKKQKDVTHTFLKMVFFSGLGKLSHPASNRNFEKIPPLLFSAIRAKINFSDKVVTFANHVLIKS